MNGKTFDIPEFKITQDAYAFAKTANKEQIKKLQRLFVDNLITWLDFREKGIEKEAQEITFKNHLVREAIEQFYINRIEKLLEEKYGKEWRTQGSQGPGQGIYREHDQRIVTGLHESAAGIFSRKQSLDQGAIKGYSSRFREATRLEDLFYRKLENHFENLRYQAYRENEVQKTSQKQDLKYYRIIVKSMGSVKEYSHVVALDKNLEKKALSEVLNKAAKSFIKNNYTLYEVSQTEKLQVTVKDVPAEEIQKDLYRGR